MHIDYLYEEELDESSIKKLRKNYLYSLSDANWNKLLQFFILEAKYTVDETADICLKILRKYNLEGTYPFFLKYN